MDQATLAARIALQQALNQRELAASSAIHSESVAHMTTHKQLLKAAAELSKGNVPLLVEVDERAYYLVESRSNFIGKLVDLQVSGNVFDHISQIVLDVLRRIITTDEPVPNGDVTLKFCVTSGDVYLVDPLAMSCGCERGSNQARETCWHYAMVDNWITAWQAMDDALADRLHDVQLLVNEVKGYPV